jgi:hypothetical protein
MSWTRRRLAAIVLALACLLAAAGCVSVPTSGPIETVGGQQPGCQNCLNVEVALPAPGAKPKEIVEGYLRATSNYQPNYSVAKQFLTKMTAEKWSPEGEVTIYIERSVTATTKKPDVVRLEGRHVGSLGADRTFTAHDEEMSIDFGLAKDENGEWRINRLPKAGLMVNKVYFESFYQNYNLYFVGSGGSLVPNPIWIPALRNPANVASALVKALLNGPSKWLKPAVSTAIPPNTSLSVDSVTITDGIAEVPLSDSLQALSDAQRSLLAAQIVYTLRQVGGVKGVLIKVNQQPYRLPGSDPSTLAVSVDAISPNMGPVPSLAGDQLYVVSKGLAGLRPGAVARVTTTSGSPNVSALPGPLGEGRYAVDALAVSVTNTDLAVTTNSHTTLLRTPIVTEDTNKTGKTSTTTEPQILLRGVSRLLKPQFTRSGEIWAIEGPSDSQRMWMFKADDNKPIEINWSLPKNVTAFKISPDGTQMALVRQAGIRSELGIARIIRSDTQVVVDGWRALDTTQTYVQPQIERIHDIAWLDATELLVLGGPAGTGALAPIQVAEDASRISQAEPENWDASGLAVLPGTPKAVIVGRSGQTWRYNGNQWQQFMDKISTIAYPG